MKQEKDSRVKERVVAQMPSQKSLCARSEQRIKTTMEKAMNINILRNSILALGLAAVAALPAQAGTTTYTIKDAGTFSGYTDTTTSDTFAGTGFVGIYPTYTTDFGSAGPAFAHLLGLENYNGIFSETE